MDPNRKPPAIKQEYSFLFNGPLGNSPIPDARKLAILALIDSGFVTSDQLIEALEDQLGRPSVFALLVIACDEGLLRFKTMVNRERHFGLTQKARDSLAALITSSPE